ncbi:metalloregulator ArsR/SmtB family transcription factor [Terasakiella sp. A23]|uniref:ArsR/SmtB family transcription factor n=1 Tax=Terasakiella sp. FCG-A23 TaxID=3080561 RepID=UPI002953ACED|nr:metalloregulator ArsR/SmtB family transcription factor [Terasakiella sp. A23]MDV7338931.1 metalloregulator ArsR/SmtB family transcription factor [Terasakiella sp. A23]
MDTILSALKAIGEPTRMRVMALCAQGDLTVSELVHILGQSQPRVSRHLKLLCEAGLLQRLREGSWVFHRLSVEPENLDMVNKLVGIIPYDDEVIVRDRQRLEEVKQDRAEKAASYFNQNAQRWEEIRALHADDHEVENALLNVLGSSKAEEFLDIGTGTGRLLELFSPHIRQGWGVDLSTEMLAIARAKIEEGGLANCAVRQGDMYQVPFSADSFDLVTIHQVLHYTDEPATAIGEAARVLKSGGKLAVVDFAPHEEESLRTQYQHRRLGFSEGEVTRICQDCGLNVTSVQHLPGTPLTVTVWVAEKE